MPTSVSPTLGQFVWHELMVPDLEAAKQFYGGLFGWTFKASTIGSAAYMEIFADKAAQGGMMASPGTGDIPPHWMGYVSVEDVDATAGAAAEAGGKVLVSPTEIPGVGRFAVVTDPQGGAIAPFKSAGWQPEDAETPAPNTFCWDQLHVADPAAVAPFYASVVGWRAVGGGEMTVFMRGAQQAASAIPLDVEAPGHWLPYVYVPDLALARQKALALGGTVLVKQHDLLGVGSVSVLRDPQGAVIGLFGNMRA